MTRPTITPRWAEVVQNEPITGLPNKVEPTEELKDSGLLDNENLTRQHYNFLNDLYSKWVNYFDNLHGLNSVYVTTNAAVDETTLATDFGGTWQPTGEIVTTGTGATTLYTFQRTQF